MNAAFPQTFRFPVATFVATTAFALLAAGCATQSGKTIAETVPALDARIGTKDGTLDRTFESPWSEQSAAWDGTSPLTAEAAVRCALANNRQLRRTLVEVDRRRALIRRGSPLPQDSPVCVCSPSTGSTGTRCVSSSARSPS